MRLQKMFWITLWKKKYTCVLFPFVSHRILKDDINPLLS